MNKKFVYQVGNKKKTCVPFNFKPSWFTWTLLLAFYRGKLKSNGEKASPCFIPFLIGNMSDKCLPYQFHGNTKLIENIIQDSPPKWIISSPQCIIADTLPHCISIFSQVFDECRIYDSSWLVSKSTLMIPNNFLYIWSWPW